MREYNSIWNKVPNGFGVGGGMIVPLKKQQLKHYNYGHQDSTI